jgi:hypothetical protein
VKDTGTGHVNEAWPATGWHWRRQCSDPNRYGPGQFHPTAFRTVGRTGPVGFGLDPPALRGALGGG